MSSPDENRSLSKYGITPVFIFYYFQIEVGLVIDLACFFKNFLVPLFDLFSFFHGFGLFDTLG